MARGNTIGRAERTKGPRVPRSTIARRAKAFLALFRQTLQEATSPATSCRFSHVHNARRNDDRGAKTREARREIVSHRASSCPSWDRTRTLLIQSQACCQLHQGAPMLVGSQRYQTRRRTAVNRASEQVLPTYPVHRCASVRLTLLTPLQQWS